MRKTGGSGSGSAQRVVRVTPASVTGGIGKNQSKAGRRRGADSKGRKALVRMDIDDGQGPSKRDNAGRGNRRGSPRRGRRGGFRGGRGGRGGRPAAPNRDKLDLELDNYMLRDEKAGRSNLDNDLDAYMTGTSTTAAL